MPTTAWRCLFWLCKMWLIMILMLVCFMMEYLVELPFNLMTRLDARSRVRR